MLLGFAAGVVGFAGVVVGGVGMFVACSGIEGKGGIVSRWKFGLGSMVDWEGSRAAGSMGLGKCLCKVGVADRFVMGKVGISLEVLLSAFLQFASSLQYHRKKTFLLMICQ